MTEMRTLAIGIAIAILVLVLTGGRLFFLPLLFVPFGLFSRLAAASGAARPS